MGVLEDREDARAVGGGTPPFGGAAALLRLLKDYRLGLKPDFFSARTK